MKQVELDYPIAENRSKGFEEYDYEESIYLKTLREEMVSDSIYVPANAIVWEDVTVDGWKDKIKLRIYRQNGDRLRPVMLYIHGGAWCGGSIELTEDYCKAVADLGDITVVSVDYHLAPEHPFPEGIEDCYRVLEWIWDNSTKLNVDKNNITLSGDSAGGNFSASLSQMAKERGKIKVKNQILIYPGLSLRPEDGVGGDEEYAKRSMGIVIKWYLGGTDPSNPYACPIAAASFSGLPRTLIAIGGLDGMRFKDIQYAEKLDKAGNDVTLAFFKNTNHGFVAKIGKAPQGLDMAKLAAKMIRSLI